MFNFNGLNGNSLKLNSVENENIKIGSNSLSNAENAEEDVSIMKDSSEEVDNYGDEASFSTASNATGKTTEGDGDLSSLLDANRDGKITAQELDDYNNKDVTSDLDANGDGKITQEEIDNYYKSKGVNTPSSSENTEVKTDEPSDTKKTEKTKEPYNPDEGYQWDPSPFGMLQNHMHIMNTPYDAVKALGIESTDELKNKSGEELYEMYKDAMSSFEHDCNNMRECSVLVTILTYCDVDKISEFFDVCNKNGNKVQNVLSYLNYTKNSMFPEHDTKAQFLYRLNKYNSEFTPNEYGASYTKGFFYA